MAYNEKHLVKLADLKALGTKQKEVADALAARVDTLENVGSQANVLEGVKVNGTALAIPPTPLLRAACTRPPWMKRAM